MPRNGHDIPEEAQKDLEMSSHLSYLFTRSGHLWQDYPEVSLSMYKLEFFLCVVPVHVPMMLLQLGFFRRSLPSQKQTFSQLFHCAQYLEKAESNESANTVSLNTTWSVLKMSPTSNYNSIQAVAIGLQQQHLPPNKKHFPDISKTLEHYTAEGTSLPNNRLTF